MINILIVFISIMLSSNHILTNDYLTILFTGIATVGALINKNDRYKMIIMLYYVIVILSV